MAQEESLGFGLFSTHTRCLNPLSLLPFAHSAKTKIKDMAWRCGSLSRSLLSAARTAPTRSSISHLHRPSSPSLRSHLLHPRRPLITLPRTLGVLGCTQSLLPLHSADAAARLTSHISVDSRACCELSQGT